ncbi:MAG: transporter substrate-binding domain-containing protein [Lachnospiraceae bacterium]|nr:transporter substrate-binding domain-containing protein [Lachnospiraceae bacterium]
MKNLKKFPILALAVLAILSLTGCSKVPENTVFSVNDLCGKKIGVQLGTTGDIYASDYEDLESGVFPQNYEGEASTVKRFHHGTDAVSALKQGEIDCIIVDEQPAKAIIEENDDLMILDEKFSTEEYAICISKDNVELTTSINSSLSELKTDGTLEAIISNYIGDETKGRSPYESPASVDRSKGTLVMATNVDFKPYEYYVDKEIVGIDVDIAQAICDKLGYELKIEDMEFDAVINAVQSGRADIGVAAITVTDERLQSVDFTDSYATSTQVIIVRKK